MEFENYWAFAMFDILQIKNLLSILYVVVLVKLTSKKKKKKDFEYEYFFSVPQNRLTAK